MVSWNGIVVPVFHLATLLDFESSDERTLKVLIIGQGEDAVGLRVAATPFRIILRSEQKLARPPPLPQALQPFARACYRTDRIWVDWDYRGFFDALAKRF
jgi:chemotaxis signal transduction protein